jgi:hypothetical protein
MSPPVVVQCPGCSRSFSIAEAARGKRTRCKQCGRTFLAAETVGDAPAPPPAAPGLPAAIGRFQVRARVGVGSFGAVYRAFDPQLDREVALKVPRPGVLDEPRRVERFLREARAAARLRHPHIVPVFDAGKDGEQYYIASAFVEGNSLAAAVDEKGMDFRRAAQVVRELAEALAYAHEQGIVHRDVKPANVMLDGKGRPHLMDFGLASKQDESEKLTNDGALLGTPAYMAPEQAGGQKGEAQPASDQYSLGVLLYELLTGQTPFAGTPSIVLYHAINTEPKPPHSLRPDVPRDLETICLKAMAKRAEERYADCQALADDLRRWLEGEPIAARPLGFGERLLRWSRREPRLAGALGLAAAALLAVAAVLAISSAQQAALTREAQDKAALAQKAEADARDAEREAQEQRGKAVAALAEADKAQGQTKAALAKAEERRLEAEKASAEAKAAQNLAEEQGRKAADALAKSEEALKALKEERGKTVAAEDKTRDERWDAYLKWLDRANTELASSGLDKAKADCQAALQNCPKEFRGFEWYYLNGRSSNRALAPTILSPRAAPPRCFAFSSDGSRFAGGSRDGDLKVWDLRTEKQVLDLVGHRGFVNCIAFQPGGLSLASGGQDKTVRVWNLQTGKETARFEKHAAELSHLSLSGGRVVSVDQDGACFVWDANTTEVIFDARKRFGLVLAAALSAGGKRLVLATKEKGLVWDLEAARAEREAPELPLTGGRAHADDKRVWGWSRGDVVIWEIETGKVTRRHLASPGAPLGVSPDGARLVAVVGRGVMCWDLRTGKEVSSFDSRSARAEGSEVVFSPEGTGLAYADYEKFIVWDARPSREPLPTTPFGK